MAGVTRLKWFPVLARLPTRHTPLAPSPTVVGLPSARALVPWLTPPEEGLSAIASEVRVAYDMYRPTKCIDLAQR